MSTDRNQLPIFSDSPGERQKLEAENRALKARLEAILQIVANSTKACEACGMRMYLVRNAATGKFIPFQSDGQSHFKTCPKAAEFSKGGGGER